MAFDPNGTFKIAKCGGEKCGKPIEKISGKPWKGRAYHIKQAEAKGFIIGQNCMYLQNANEKAYWYEGDDSSGPSGPETWRFDPEDGKDHSKPTSNEKEGLTFSGRGKTVEVPDSIAGGRTGNFAV